MTSWKTATLALVAFFAILPYSASVQNQSEIDPEIIKSVFGTYDEWIRRSNNKSNQSKEDCFCVLRTLCKTNGDLSGEIIIDIRSSPENICSSYMEVCCKKEDIVDPSEIEEPVKVNVGCGIRNTNGIDFRIKGNNENESEFGEFPWMVAITSLETFGKLNQKLYVYVCGGALIHPQVVLTAAHCVNSHKDFVIRAGEWDTQTEKEPLAYQDRRVSSIKIHKSYYDKLALNDVALLFLEKPVDITDNVNVVCLPAQNTNFDYSKCVATGWGKDLFGKKGKYQVIMKKIELPIVPKNNCQSLLRSTRLGPHFKLHKSFICAGGEVGKDTCKGDGGSPLVCPIRGKEDQYQQAGIVSWGIGCGSNIPGVYVNVALFRDWIDRQMRAKNLNLT